MDPECTPQTISATSVGSHQPAEGREESTTDPLAVSKELIEELDNGTYLIWGVMSTKKGAEDISGVREEIPIHAIHVSGNNRSPSMAQGES